MIQSQEETEESLTSLINELIAEEGNDIVPDTLVTLPEKDTPYPSLLMETDYHEGLTDEQVADRRKAHGRNCLTQNTTNNWIKFLSFFVGPIQFVMEVIDPPICLAIQDQHVLTYFSLYIPGRDCSCRWIAQLD